MQLFIMINAKDFFFAPVWMEVYELFVFIYLKQITALSYSDCILF